MAALDHDVTISWNDRPHRVAVVIVTYGSGKFLSRCIESLSAQTRLPDRIIVVDNCSPDPSYLDDLSGRDTIQVIRNAWNTGFCAANNDGYQLARGFDFVLFLNPDAFPQHRFLEHAVAWMESPDNSGCGVLTGALLGYDMANLCPTGKIDSTGIFQKWYGKWYDRGQGSHWVPPAPDAAPEDVPAICGALMFCRSRALADSLSDLGDVFDRRFFMYKEDIDLSLRIRRHGWKLTYVPTLTCFHCRGWQNRRAMSNASRYRSARNELRVCLRNKGRGIVYSTLKLMATLLENAWNTLSSRLTRLHSPDPKARIR